MEGVEEDRNGGEHDEIHTRMEMTGRSMPLKDRIDLGPLDKYTVYNKFPYKMALHILLTILMTMTIFVQVQTN